jgi:lipid II:glycine glycyltransferase (peptidoglycan interpeptide bridge formation enzyme)
MRSWAEVQTEARPVVARYFVARRRGDIVGASVVLRPAFAGIVSPVAWIERGPVVQSLDELPAVLDALANVARRHGCLFLRVMPHVAGDDIARVTSILTSARFANAQARWGRATRTLHFDLAAVTEETIFAGASKEGLRRKLRQAERAGATVRRGRGSEVSVLRELHGKMMKAQGRKSQPDAWFDGVAKRVDAEPESYALFITELDHRIINVTFIVRTGRVATFLMGASAADESSFSISVLGMSAGIRWAHGVGVQTFDLNGLPDEGDEDPKRNSIAQFKRSFSKTMVHFAPAYRRWLLF